VADDGFRSGPDDVRFFQLFAAGDCHHRQFGRESFDVFGFLLEEALRNQEREIDVLVTGGLEAIVELTLEQLPDRISIGFDDHAAFDDLGRLGHVSLEDDILIPSGKVLAARGDGRFGHSEC